MNREELIKYGLIVLLSVLILFILMRVVDLKQLKSLFVQENYESNQYAPVRQSSGNRDTQPFVQNTQPFVQNTPTASYNVKQEVVPVPESTQFVDSSANVNPNEVSPSLKFKACNLSDNVKPEDLLPLGNTEFSSLNPILDGGLKNKQFLDPTKLMGTNTVGQSNRNQSYDLRSEPAIQKRDVGPWMNTTIEADLTRRPLE